MGLFFGTPYIILNGKDSRFTRSEFPRFCNGASLYLRLFMGAARVWGGVLRVPICVLRTLRNKLTIKERIRILGRRTDQLVVGSVLTIRRPPVRNPRGACFQNG